MDGFHISNPSFSRNQVDTQCYLIMPLEEGFFCRVVDSVLSMVELFYTYNKYLLPQNVTFISIWPRL
jgi:hypothetical protein